MSPTFTPKNGSRTPWLRNTFLMLSEPSALSSATISFAVMSVLPIDFAEGRAQPIPGLHPRHDCNTLPCVPKFAKLICHRATDWCKIILASERIDFRYFREGSNFLLGSG